MATQVALHRADLDQVVLQATNDLASGMQGVSDADAHGYRDALAEVLQGLAGFYAPAAATLGADWYDELRSEAEVKGRFQAIVARLPDVGRTEALAGWAVEPLFGATPSVAKTIERASGGLQRIILDADRDTIARSSIADPSAAGWRREGSGECSFCRMLIGRGAVYSEATVRFRSHDHCRCVGVPDFGGPRLTLDSGSPKPKARGSSAMKAQEGSPASAFSPGAQTAERAAFIERQIKQMEADLTAGRGTPWQRDMVRQLRKEQAALRIP
jgi:hypothetical protein